MNKTLGQKIAYLFAILCYLAAGGCALGAVLYQPASELDPIHASLLASVIFFGGSGLVLHVIATARLKGILSAAGTTDPAMDRHEAPPRR